jgi:threonine dehydrogenase-like Zn-dependent dehydrogenase
VYPGDTVAVFGAGPIGQMAGYFAIGEGAKKIIFVDTEPRLSQIRERFPAQHKDKLEVVDFKKLSHGITSGKTVVDRLKELCDGRGPDVALECAAGEYAKGWAHWLEMAVGAETDTSEIINEMIEGVRNYGRCGVTGVYVGYVCFVSTLFLDSQLTDYYLDKSLQCGIAHATRNSSHWQRPGTCTQVLGGATGPDSKGRAGCLADGVSSRALGGPRQGVLQVPETRGWYSEGVCRDQALIPES